MKCAACNFDDKTLYKQDSFQELNLYVKIDNQEENVDAYCKSFEDGRFKKVWMELYRCPKCGTIRSD